jgi:hypothetical protein
MCMFTIFLIPSTQLHSINTVLFILTHYRLWPYFWVIFEWYTHLNINRVNHHRELKQGVCKKKKTLLILGSCVYDTRIVYIEHYRMLKVNKEHVLNLTQDSNMNVTISTTGKKPSILPPKCICTFCLVTRVNSHSMPDLHKLIILTLEWHIFLDAST